MIQLAHLDESIPYRQQLQGEEGPIVLINTFTAPDGKVDEVVEAWKWDAQYFQKQPGYISAQLHRGTAGSRVLVNVAVWESVAQLRAAFSTEEFQKARSHYPDGSFSYPHIFQKVAVEGVCVA
ncbi:antibiotic biosynthesis monooxygenase family protein [Streptomyces yaanensis]|uniref:Antibiotic biosynthesis monooxygenase family protein n=1 Tax=Streptomyces yaanensis TaxID=1142239 RepID=A0ABV7SQ79_9ACTN|nr:antibiotic biosynthesis monooxygenase family protein [Streptomyces sp. CGMCC 4.7035]WNC00413.1 antibiotic biosynthesis monooxygenase family protein [Streptomyces sp. CGMCC 4.7035]